MGGRKRPRTFLDDMHDARVTYSDEGDLAFDITAVKWRKSPPPPPVEEEEEEEEEAEGEPSVPATEVENSENLSSPTTTAADERSDTDSDLAKE